jgi:hypothetical protein
LKIESLTIDTASLPGSPETSYQTAPLVDYSIALRQRAAELFRRIKERLGAKAKEYKGSFSVFAASSNVTAAKIVIYEAGKGKMNGTDQLLGDGVYLLIRVENGRGGRTIGVAPKHHERFAYFRLTDEQGLEEMADFIVTYTAAQ